MTLPLHPTARAQGKVILLGEHAVVYGHPAIAAGLPDALELTATALDDAAAFCRLRIPAWDLDETLHPASDHPVARAALEVLGFCDGPVTGWRIEGVTRLPSRAGLGSSAALSVALARLVLGPAADAESIVQASLAGERVFHGDPSGVDSEVAARGGVLRFVRGTAPERVALRQPLPLLLIPSGIPRSTADQIARARVRLERFPRLLRPVLTQLETAVQLGIDALNTHDLDTFGEIMNVSHELLSTLDVSASGLDELCSIARLHGALGAKLTGAGGGGCVVALPPSDPAPLLHALRSRDLDPLLVNVLP